MVCLQHPLVKSNDPCGGQSLICPECLPSQGSVFSPVFLGSNRTAGMLLSPGSRCSQVLPGEGHPPVIRSRQHRLG